MLVFLHFFEVNLHCSFGVASGSTGVVDELVKFVETHPAGIEPKDKQHALNEVRLSRTIGTHNAGKVAMKGPDNLPSCVRFEVFQDEMVDY